MADGMLSGLLDPNWQDQLAILLSVALAAILGGVIGLEREMADRPAGLRTHALLTVSACLLVGLSDTLVDHFVARSIPELLRADPIRVVEAIVTGTAFLGAGTIFRHRSSSHIEGLTTAASLLVVASIGIAVALKQVFLAIGITLLCLVLLRLARVFESKESDSRDRSDAR